MWRTISLVIFAFWLLMTSLLVRYLWFPEGNHFTEVPTSVVLRRFLEQGNKLSNAATLRIFRREQDIGFANLGVSREPGTESDYTVRLTCFPVKGAFPPIEEKLSMSLTLKLRNVEEFGAMTIRIRKDPSIAAQKRAAALAKLKGVRRTAKDEAAPRMVEISWQAGQQAPSVTISGGDDEDALSATMVQTIIAQVLGGAGGNLGSAAGLNIPGMPSLSRLTGSSLPATRKGEGTETPPSPQSGASPTFPVAPASDAEPGLLQVRARETEMVFAGQKSKGHLLEFSLMNQWKARAFITEAGEFALMDLPEGYRLVDTVIHGLVPDYDAEDEAEAAAEAAAAAAKK